MSARREALWHLGVSSKIERAIEKEISDAVTYYLKEVRIMVHADGKVSTYLPDSSFSRDFSLRRIITDCVESYKHGGAKVDRLRKMDAPDLLKLRKVLADSVRLIDREIARAVDD